MHQAILRRAPLHPEIVEASRLGFIRSSSAAISETVAAEIEQLFGAPLLEAYSMTEAAHQMTSNPLPPAARKARSVGLPMGVEVAILDKGGRELEQGQVGEVAIRGPTVITAYERNPMAGESAFVNGWFRTGDQGFLDADGYLLLTGRLKELIIRGGQNIAPVEVEEALLTHRAVAEAVCFAMPHRSLGEDVAAVVILKKRHEAGEAELRRHVAGLLADFKVPRRVFFLDELPKGPTGKLQRIGLSERLGLDAEIERDVSAEDDDITGLERRIAEIWAAELGLEHVGLDEDYFALGGDSLQAIEIFLEIEKLLGKPLPPTILFEASTVREMTHRIELDVGAGCLVPIRLSAEGPAFFCVHPRSGEVIGFSSIVRHLKEECSFYGLQPVGRDGKSRPLMSIEEMADRYIGEVRAVQPEGPYYLGGLSFGGLIAYEMAQRLQAQGEQIALLGLIDTYYPYKPNEVGFGQRIASWVATHHERYGALPREERGQYVRNRLRHAYLLSVNGLKRRLYGFRAGGDPEKVVNVGRRIRYANTIAFENYTPPPYTGGATYFRAKRSASRPKIVQERWRDLIAGPLDIYPIPGRHSALLDEPHVQGLAHALDEALRAVRE
jgi:thioesterase domain-containing protein/acyl carrier protein